ncbi:MAG: penicillin acylase family protein [Chloroherpetonaceae bacterium]|nr:penicillin acylase family protein [Chloroherpetonaceae bacterium]MCS7210923.1 penicillin acylase family protein [Chloroherpetonaceae bacterium]MDW8019571.1 penicillin acylase family protein [Chloroherpetonaceae bacterium]
MKRTTKILIGLSLSLLAIGCGAAAAFYAILRKSVPDYEARFEIKGLQQVVKIYYDEYAAAHIEAQSEADLFFAQGFAHARERLWQMDLARRAAKGELAEILGESALSFDRLFRTVGLRHIADSLWNSNILSPESRAVLIAYSQGVNAYLEQIKAGKAVLPIEFDILQYEPAAWRPEDCLAIARLMGWELNIAWHIDVALADITAQVGYEKAKHLYPDYPKDKPTILPALPDTSKRTAAVLRLWQELDKAYREFAGVMGSHIGSNSWAVTRSKSAAGNAILANDPHLGFSAPARWYEMHLCCRAAGINAAGCSLPGVPCIVLGRNDSIAWGLTNMMLDDCDFFALLDSTETLQERVEEIRLKGAASVPLRVRWGRHGVVISDQIYSGFQQAQSPLLDAYTISMRWTGQELSDEVATFLGILKAKNWQDFRAALRHYGLPGQNFLYADAAGHIGYQAAGKLPIRLDKQGFLLRDARKPEQDWQGFVPFDELPMLFDPPSDMIVTANNKIVPDGYKYYISALWEPPSRAERITALLRSKERFSAEDFEKMQTDVISPFAQETLRFLLSALANDTLSMHQRPIQFLRNWNGEFQAHSIAATIYSQWLKQLLRNTLHDELGENLFQNYLSLVNAPTRVIGQLLADSTVVTEVKDSTVVQVVRYNIWFDDVRTRAVETRDDIIRKSFNEAVEILRREIGENEADWQWGRVHQLTLRHVFGQKAKDGTENPLGKVFNLGPFRTAGTSTTINNGEYPYRSSDSTGTALIDASQKLGASSRRVVDLSEQDFWSVLPGGNSGSVISPHYADQLPLWLQGKLRRFTMNLRQLQEKNAPTTLLVPVQTKLSAQHP